MAISKARDIATSIGKAVKADRITSAGLIPSSAAAFSVYDSTVSLPTSDIAVGSQAYISSNQRLYIRGTGGWYNIATVNNTPSINSVQTAAGDSSPFSLATDGSTTTVITINATDSEGFPITFTATTDVGFDSIATVSNDSSVFTITPLSEDSAGTATSGTLTFKASDGVNIASEVATFTLIFRITNSNFTNTLLKASGNNGTNVTMTGVTVNGDASTQAFSPYHPGGYSTYFDGTGDYLSLSDHASLQMGSGDFTIEAWVYVNAHKNSNYIYSYSFPYQFTMDSNGHLESYFNDGDNFNSYIIVQGSTAIPTSTWTHVAVVRNGNTFTQFVNGIQDGTVTSSATLGTPSSYDPIIGNWGGGSYSFDGYIRDLRIVKGTAVYSANFTPPTVRLTTISGSGYDTSLLACHLPYIGDGSTNNHTVTANGNTHTRRFSPYDYTVYSTSNHGASVYFDGTGDYLTVAHNINLELQDSNFTLECFVYPTSTNSAQILGKRSASANYGGYAIYWSSSKFGALIDTDTSTPWAVSLLTTETFLINTWYHVAFTRNGNNVYLYVNGIQKATTSFSGTANTNSSTSFSVGAIGNGDQPLTGFVSDARLVKGTAVYTSAFTPPTTPLSSINGTSILTCDDAPNVFDGTGQARVKTDGAKSSTSSTKYASSNIQTGTSDRVYFYPTTSTSEFDNITGDFTVEAWIKLDSSTQNYADILLYRDESNTTNPHISLRFGNSGFGYHLQFRVTNSGSSYVHSVNLTQSDFTSSFRHVALVRTNGLIKIFVDGTLKKVNTGADPSSFPNSHVAFSNTLSAVDRFEVGGAFDGNIEDFRFTKNLARYPFIPPSETLTAVTNTVLLTAHAATITGTNNAGDTITVSPQEQAAVSNFAPHPGMKSVYFDGTDDRLEVASIPNLSTGPYTIEGWYYFNSDPNSSTYLLWSLNTTNSTGYAQLQTVSGNNFLRLQQRGGQHLTNGNTFDMIANKWYHIATVWDGSNMRVFVNGSVVLSSTTNVIQNAGNGLTINGDGGGSLQFAGYISNFRIINGTALYTDSFTPPAAELKG